MEMNYKNPSVEVDRRIFCWCIYAWKKTPGSTGGEKKSCAAIKTASLMRAEDIDKEGTSHYNESCSNALRSNRRFKYECKF